MRKLCVACKLIAYTRVKEFFRTQFNSFLKSKKSGTVVHRKVNMHCENCTSFTGSLDRTFAFSRTQFSIADFATQYSGTCKLAPALLEVQSGG